MTSPDHLSWWNSITGGHRCSGDIDYAVGNAGLNAKYHASSHRVCVCCGVYSGGTRQLVEAKYEGVP
jgi:hypothetical protein